MSRRPTPEKPQAVRFTEAACQSGAGENEAAFKAKRAPIARRKLKEDGPGPTKDAEP